MDESKEMDLSKYQKIEIEKVKTYSIQKRKSKVKTAEFAKVVDKGSTFKQFYESLPNILKGNDLRILVDLMVRACQTNKPIIVMMGAHVIKCGLGPVLIDLLQKKIISCLAMNGAGAIHDSELAYWGKTSEAGAKHSESQEGLQSGSLYRRIAVDHV